MKLRQNSLLVFCILAILLMVTLLAGCSRKDKSVSNLPPAKSFLDSSLAQKLPPTTYGYLFWDMERPSAKQYLKQNTDSVSSLKKKIESILPTQEGTQEKSTATALHVLNWLIEHGVLPTDGKSPLITQGVSFLEVKDDLPLPGIGAYLVTRKGTDTQKLLTDLRELLESEGAKTIDLKGEDFRYGFSVLSQKASETPSGEAIPLVHIATDEKLISLASSNMLLNRAFHVDTGEKMNGAKRIQQTAPYKKLRGAYRGENEFLFGYFDLDRLIKRIAQLVPQEQIKKLPFALEDIPGEAIGMRVSYDGSTVLSDIGILLEETKLQKTPILHTALTPTGEKAASPTAPENSIFYLSLNSSIIRALQSFAKENGTPKQRAGLDEMVKILSGLGGLGLGVLPSDGSTVFPGIFLEVGTTKESENPIGEVKKTLTLLASSQGIPATAWQKKKIEGVDVDYLLTPLGIGMFLAASGQTGESPSILIGSSENAIRDLLLARAGNGKNLFSGLPKNLQAQLGGTSPLFVGYFNGERTVDLIKSLESSLSMFTQGKPLLPKEQLEEIRNVGTSYSLASYRDGLLNFSGVSSLTAKKQP